MVFGNNQHQDPDDFFSDTRMSFGDHLEDLRIHLWRAVGGFLIALLASFAIGKPVLNFIAAPVVAELQAYWERYYDKKHRDLLADERRDGRQVVAPLTTVILLNKQDLGIKSNEPEPVLDVLPAVGPILEKLDVPDWLNAQQVKGGQLIPVRAVIQDPMPIIIAITRGQLKVKKPSLSTLNVQEAFLVYFKVSVVTGIVLASPWIFMQIWAFVAAGLYPQEKRYVNVFLPVSIVLFLAGVLVCEFLVIPKAVEALLWFNEWLDLEPDFRLNEWLGFAIFMPLVFGLSFQTPLVMLFMERIGVVTVETFRAKRRIAWFVMAVFAAIITP